MKLEFYKKISKIDEKKYNTPEEEVFIFPLSFSQQRLWFLQQIVPDNPFYNVSTALRLTGSLNIKALEQTLNEIIRRHEILRTQFFEIDGEPVQGILPHLTLSLPILDLTHLSPTEREQEAKRLAVQAAKSPFNLAQDILLRVKLLKLDQTEFVLLLNLHHIIADGWSIGVLLQELGILYTAFEENKPSPLPELPIQYADFSEWQRQFLQGDVLAKQLSYWRQQLKEICDLNLPTDRPRPPQQSFQGRCQTFELSPSLTQALEVLSQQQDVTLFMTLLAAFQSLLHRYTQQEDIAVGSPIANRNRAEIEGLIGFFVNSLVLRTQFKGNPTFCELLKQVKAITLDAYAHQDLPFEKLVEDLHPERDLSRNPLFQVSFSLQNTPIKPLELPDLRLSLLEFDHSSAKLDLEVHLWQDLQSLKGEVISSTDLFDAPTITRMLGHFQTLLEAIIANPNQLIKTLPILTTAEQHQLLMDWNNPQNAHFSEPDQLLFHQKFEAQVKNTPDAIALIFEDQSLTYHELNIKANQLAHQLMEFGVKPDQLVGICLERSCNRIVALLAVLKAGGAYLPLEPDSPQERLKFIIENAELSILIIQSSLARLFHKNKNLSIINLDEDNPLSKYSSENPHVNLTPNHLAYVIYTSGSTGKPKGVLIEHRGLSNLIAAQIEVFNIKPSDRILQFAPFSFDASIFEIVMALATGATLYLAQKETLLPGLEFIQFLQKNAITHATLPPAVLAVLPPASLPSLQTIIAAGEPCTPEIVKTWARGRRFFNAYGPTEATVWATVAELTRSTGMPPIGRPIRNTQIYILDAQQQPVPIGIAGELYIGGAGLARGYLNNPELTAQTFIPNPFAKAEGRGQKAEGEGKKEEKLTVSSALKLYKTGDLARYLPDGNIEFLGRLDDQVKIRGFRIELAEIEAVCYQHPAVQAAAVIAREDAPGDKRLVAYLVSSPQQRPSIPQLRRFLQTQLPDYMIPAALIFLDALPLTASGKVDRRALLMSDRTYPNPNTEIIAPRNETEKAIAQIWANVLNLEQVGIHDNFFELGGNSLLAVRLIAQINQQLNQNLPLATLFLNPTVAELAHHVISKRKDLPDSPLVAIKPTGSRPAFFCIHPIFGVVFPYYEFAYTLDQQQPFYGVQPLGLDGKASPLTRIEDMATAYIQAIRNVQPNGPYLIGGWSFGGHVAYEMAQQFIQGGDEVALLAILDTPAPLISYQPSLCETLQFLATTATPYIFPFILDYVKLILSQYAQNPAFSNQSQQQILNEFLLLSVLRIYNANSQAILNYIPQPYPGKITLFKSHQKRPAHAQDLTMGWNKLTPDVDVHLVPGNHLTMLRKPHVQVLAEKLTQVISSLLNPIL